MPESLNFTGLYKDGRGGIQVSVSDVKWYGDGDLETGIWRINELLYHAPNTKHLGLMEIFLDRFWSYRKESD